jgi:hypothetical protein
MLTLQKICSYEQYVSCFPFGDDDDYDDDDDDDDDDDYDDDNYENNSNKRIKMYPHCSGRVVAGC